MTNSPKVTREDIALLEEILGATGKWMHSRDIARHPKWKEANEDMSPAHSERMIRAIANASNGSVISWPGSAGYRLRAKATPEEVETGIRKLLHQAAEMVRRANQIEQFGSNRKEGVLL